MIAFGSPRSHVARLVQGSVVVSCSMHLIMCALCVTCNLHKDMLDAAKVRADRAGHIAADDAFVVLPVPWTLLAMPSAVQHAWYLVSWDHDQSGHTKIIQRCHTD